jgi:hypothetical protein
VEQVGLTSPGLPYVLAALSAVVLLAIVVGWPNLGRGRLWQIWLRILSLSVLQVLVLGLIFVIVNNSGEFYSSWSDLFGSDTTAGSVVAARNVPAATGRQQLEVTAKVPVKLPTGKPGGTLETVTVHGQLSGLSVAGHIYVPAAYRAGNAAGQLSVLVVISDAASSSGSPYAASRLARSAAIEMAAGRMQPLIIVMLPAAISPHDQACLTVPPGPSGGSSAQGGTFFAQDVPSAVESGFHVSTQAANWALLGDVGGGYCALQLAMDNSYVFSVAVVPRGTYASPPGVRLGTSLLRQQADLAWQLTSMPMQPISVLFAGPGSAAGPGQARQFISRARPPMRVSTTQLGGGSWPLAHVLDWIGAAVGRHAVGGAK